MRCAFYVYHEIIGANKAQEVKTDLFLKFPRTDLKAVYLATSE